MSSDPVVVKINRVYATLFCEIEMLIRCNEDPSALFMGVIRLMMQFGAAEINVDQLFSYSKYCPRCILDCQSLMDSASPSGRAYIRRALIDRGEFIQLRRFAELSREPLAMNELVEVSKSLARRHCKNAIEDFFAYVHDHPELSDFDRRRLTHALRQNDPLTAVRRL